MCGRFTLITPAEVLADLFGVDHEFAVRPRYNIAPTQEVAMVVQDATGTRVWTSARWGLIPSWAKDPSIGARMINARAETAASKPAFRAAMTRRRCLIPADGFYEWQTIAGGKQPYYFTLPDHHPFAFAGLWERWQADPAHPLVSCTILTTEPNDAVARFHNRMPVILPETDYAEWLGASRLPEHRFAHMLTGSPAQALTATPVSTRVNNPRNDDPSCTATAC